MLLSTTQIHEGLQRLNGWTLAQDHACIEKTWQFKNFRLAMHFWNAVAELAEQRDHHPEFVSNYTKLCIRLTTHDAKGLTDKDLELAQDIERMANLPENRSIFGADMTT